MRVTLVKEHDDGSADVQLDDIEPETMRVLLQEGFLAILGKSTLMEKDKTAALLKAPE